MNRFIWFLGTAKASIVCLLMMLVAFLMETDKTVQNFLDGCLSNDRGSSNSTEIHPNDKLEFQCEKKYLLFHRTPKSRKAHAIYIFEMLKSAQH